jgi:hypothetical protein
VRAVDLCDALLAALPRILAADLFAVGVYGFLDCNDGQIFRAALVTGFEAFLDSGFLRPVQLAIRQRVNF